MRAVEQRQQVGAPGAPGVRDVPVALAAPSAVAVAAAWAVGTVDAEQVDRERVVCSNARRTAWSPASRARAMNPAAPAGGVLGRKNSRSHACRGSRHPTAAAPCRSSAVPVACASPRGLRDHPSGSHPAGLGRRLRPGLPAAWPIDPAQHACGHRGRGASHARSPNPARVQQPCPGRRRPTALVLPFGSPPLEEPRTAETHAPPPRSDPTGAALASFCLPARSRFAPVSGSPLAGAVGWTGHGQSPFCDGWAVTGRPPQVRC